MTMYSFARLICLALASGDASADTRKPPSGTIGDVQARVGALKAKHGATTSSPTSLPPSTSTAHAEQHPALNPSDGVSPFSSPPLPLAPSGATRAATAANPTVPGNKISTPEVGRVGGGGGGNDDAVKDALFGGASLSSSAPSSTANGKQKTSSGVGYSIPEGARGASSSQGGYADVPGNGGVGEGGGENDIDLGDLEASLGQDTGGGDDDGDYDLEAMIEAARREAAALGLGGGGGGRGSGERGGVQGVGGYDEDNAEEDEEDDIDLT